MNKQIKISFVVLVFLLLSMIGCNRKQESFRVEWSSQDSAKIVNDILSYRQEAEIFFRFDPESPFNKDTSSHYHGLKWYPPNVEYAFKSMLYRYPSQEKAIILGTKGEERHFIKFGYLLIPQDGKQISLNVYKDEGSSNNQLSIWFTDETTGKETYNVGRYVEIGEEKKDLEYEYVVDFNKAYNPYCAYSPIYSCAVPPKENHLPFAVRAGEMKYHE